jgi:uncharacterized repeat protein (TIGR03847 family)
MAVQEFDPPERFVAGTVGPPGQRTFFLQVRGAGRLTSVSLEKQQVSILADRVLDLLDTVAGGDAPEPAEGAADTAALDTPIEDEFRVNTLSLAWDEGRRVVVIEAHDHDPDEESPADDAPAGPAALHSLRVVLRPAVARAFARRCQALVSAGRPPCPFCGQPLDAGGHICPRANGYRR